MADAGIPSFFAGRSVFITGASGFMGKVLVERLLSTCPDIRQLILLMREKKGIQPDKRLLQLLQSQVFDGLRATEPGRLEKVVVVSGDVTKYDLGISEHDKAKLDHVSVVFHTAATVKLQEELKQSVDQNLRSVMSLLELLDTLPNIEVFMHVSTAFCNAELPVVDEKVYPPPMDLDELLELVEGSDIGMEEGRRITASKPNTYTFTKAMSEHVVEQHGCQRYPIGIFRPSIVVSSIRHPYPGWIENLNGPSGVIAGGVAGLLHVIQACDACRADMIPVDTAIDSLIACTWETAVDRLQEVRVYNCSTFENPTTWGRLRETLNEIMPQYPSIRAMGYPHIVVTKNRFLYQTIELFLQTIPLHLMEYIIRILSVKSPNLIKTSEKLKAMNHSLEFFGTSEWVIRSDNIARLRQRMSEADRAVYQIDTRSINWQQHFEDFVKGTRKYVMKEHDSDLIRARSRIQRIQFIYTLLKIFFVLLMFKLTTQHFSLKELFKVFLLPLQLFKKYFRF